MTTSQAVLFVFLSLSLWHKLHTQCCCSFSWSPNFLLVSAGVNCSSCMKGAARTNFIVIFTVTPSFENTVLFQLWWCEQLNLFHCFLSEVWAATCVRSWCELVAFLQLAVLLLFCPRVDKQSWRTEATTSWMGVVIRGTLLKSDANEHASNSGPEGSTSDSWPWKEHALTHNHTHLLLFGVYNHQICSEPLTLFSASLPRHLQTGFIVTAVFKSLPSVRTPPALMSSRCFNDLSLCVKWIYFFCDTSYIPSVGIMLLFLNFSHL